MLAGHTHGGQIRFPGVGAVLAPSIFGTRYAAGLFYEAPTLMHVSRGVSGLTPVRYNCRPEITLLRLVATSAGAKRRRHAGCRRSDCIRLIVPVSLSSSAPE